MTSEDFAAFIRHRSTEATRTVFNPSHMAVQMYPIVLNPDSPDSSKIYLNLDGTIQRSSSPFLKKTLDATKDYYLIETIDETRLVLKVAPFHAGVSTWCSSQFSDYLTASSKLQADLEKMDAHLSDGHPWNFVFEHSNIKFVDFGSIKQGRSENDWFWRERAQYIPLQLFYYVTYVGVLRRRLARNLHEPKQIPPEEIIKLGFESMADADCQTGFEERYRRLIDVNKERSGLWIGYRGKNIDQKELLLADPRYPTLKSVIEKDRGIHKIIDIGANDGIHSKACAEWGKQVLALEIEDASASALFEDVRDTKATVTIACATLKDYVYHLQFVHKAFWPKIDLAILFAIFHHMAHKFSYTFEMLFDELEVLGVNRILLEFVDYDDVFLCKVPKLPWYTLQDLTAAAQKRGYGLEIFPFHELGRRLVYLQKYTLVR